MEQVFSRRQCREDSSIVPGSRRGLLFVSRVGTKEDNSIFLGIKRRGGRSNYIFSRGLFLFPEFVQEKTYFPRQKEVAYGGVSIFFQKIPQNKALLLSPVKEVRGGGVNMFLQSYPRREQLYFSPLKEATIFFF